MTYEELVSILPDAHIEEVGDRRELVIYTGWSTATYDDDTGEWTITPNDLLVSMPEGL